MNQATVSSYPGSNSRKMGNNSFVLISSNFQLSATFVARSMPFVAAFSKKGHQLRTGGPGPLLIGSASSHRCTILDPSRLISRPL